MTTNRAVSRSGIRSRPGISISITSGRMTSCGNAGSREECRMRNMRSNHKRHAVIALCLVIAIIISACACSVAKPSGKDEADNEAKEYVNALNLTADSRLFETNDAVYCLTGDAQSGEVLYFSDKEYKLWIMFSVMNQRAGSSARMTFPYGTSISEISVRMSSSGDGGSREELGI